MHVVTWKPDTVVPGRSGLESFAIERVSGAIVSLDRDLSALHIRVSITSRPNVNANKARREFLRLSAIDRD
jgi:hypothetical protein